MAKEKEVTYTHTALSVFQDEKTKTWCVGYIKFNPTTGETKFDKAVPAGASQLDGCDKFKVAAVETGNVL